MFRYLLYTPMPILCSAAILACAPCETLSQKRASETQMIMEQIKRMGGHAFDLQAVPLSESAKAKLPIGLSVNFSDTKVTDQDMNLVVALENVVWLDLSLTCIGDKGLEILSSSKSLQRLQLRGTKLTKSGAKHLKHFDSLTALSLNSTEITLMIV